MMSARQVLMSLNIYGTAEKLAKADKRSKRLKGQLFMTLRTEAASSLTTHKRSFSSSRSDFRCAGFAAFLLHGAAGTAC